MKTANFPTKVKARREKALYRLKNPSPQLKERISQFTSEQIEKYNQRVACEIVTLESRV